MSRNVPHDWLELDWNGSPRRFCCTPYAGGGCGSSQTWRERTTHNRAHWFPPVKNTCAEERARVEAWQQNRRKATQKYRAKKTPLWFWN
jgi:hypothetical protein